MRYASRGYLSIFATMAVTAAERNRRKRQRKKDLKEKRRLEEENESNLETVESEEAVDIEYVAEPLPNFEECENGLAEVLHRFQVRVGDITESSDTAAVVSDEEKGENEEDEDHEEPKISNRKRKELMRPTVAELKSRVKRADLVEAHDVTAAEPCFLIDMKSIAGTVPIPRHWGRKRKYLQGKRGIEKPPFQLPDFIFKTGITEIRNALAEDESKMSAKQKNRQRVAPRMGGIDVDYRVLHDAFFKYQTIPPVTKFGDLYYEGKEFEIHKPKDMEPGIISERLRESLSMQDAVTSPPPWLTNMQRYGPPPSYPNLKIPGLNAPIPEGCNYGFHMNGWGKPPVDEMGRPLYGGDPFGKPTPISSFNDDAASSLVTSDGKHLGNRNWGALPSYGYDEEEEEGQSSEEEEEEEEEDSEGEKEVIVETRQSQVDTELPPGGVESIAPPSSGIDLRKTIGIAGDETPAPKELYTVIEQTNAKKENQAGAIFASEVAYVVPGNSTGNNDGATSVLSKQISTDKYSGNKKITDDDYDADQLAKKFKF